MSYRLFLIAFAFSMFLTACQPAVEVETQVYEADLLEEVILEATRDFTYQRDRSEYDLLVEIVGVGRLSNDEIDAGVEQIACYRLVEIYSSAGGIAASIIPLLAKYQGGKWSISLPTGNASEYDTLEENLEAVIGTSRDLEQAWGNHRCQGDPFQASPEVQKRMSEMLSDSG